MLKVLLGVIPPLFPSVSAYCMASRQMSYAKGDLPPSKTYMFLLLVQQWLIMLFYLMLGMLVLYGMALTLLLTIRRINQSLFDIVLDAVLSPWRSHLILAHAAIVLLPIAVAVVALAAQPTRNRTTRIYIEEDLRYILLLMSLSALVMFLLWITHARECTK